MGDNKDLGRLGDADRAGGLRPEPAEQSRPKALIPDAAEFERIVRFQPGYDRTMEPGGYGRGSMRILFILKGPLGATQFMIGTCWGPRSSDASTHRLIASGTIDPCRPSGWDVGYHSPTPRYEGSEPTNCDLLPGGKCHYDGSGLRADEWIEDFVTGGDEWVWRKLREEYDDLFASGRDPA